LQSHHVLILPALLQADLAETLSIWLYKPKIEQSGL